VLFCDYSANGQNPDTKFIVFNHINGKTVTRVGIITSISTKGAKEDISTQFIVFTCNDKKLVETFVKLQLKKCSSKFKLKSDKGGMPSLSAFVGM
jgi:hypothetical protein